jgi:hypothetical protein
LSAWGASAALQSDLQFSVALAEQRLQAALADPPPQSSSPIRIVCGCTVGAAVYLTAVLECVPFSTFTLLVGIPLRA